MHYFKAIVNGAVKEETFVYVIDSKTQSFLKVSSSPWLIQVIKWANLSTRKSTWVELNLGPVSFLSPAGARTHVCLQVSITHLCVCKYFHCFLFLLFKEFIKLKPLTLKASQPSKSALLEVKDKTPGGPSILNALLILFAWETLIYPPKLSPVLLECSVQAEFIIPSSVSVHSFFSIALLWHLPHVRYSFHDFSIFPITTWTPSSVLLFSAFQCQSLWPSH